MKRILVTYATMAGSTVWTTSYPNRPNNQGVCVSANAMPGFRLTFNPFLRRFVRSGRRVSAFSAAGWNMAV